MSITSDKQWATISVRPPKATIAQYNKINKYHLQGTSPPRQGHLLEARAPKNTFFTAKSSNIIRMSPYSEGWCIFKISIILGVSVAMVANMVTMATSFSVF